ncbi:MAG TPA: hypothetical protein VFN62_12665 [Acidobacteriaceae bacterium]|nr:hypothetical protein [Acidobacteriaceae bacterium]
MNKFLRQTWMQVVLVYAGLFLLMWIGLRYTSSSDLASTILWVVGILFSIAFTVYTSFRTGKFSTRPQWWLDFATDKKHRPKTDSQ